MKFMNIKLKKIVCNLLILKIKRLEHNSKAPRKVDSVLFRLAKLFTKSQFFALDPIKITLTFKVGKMARGKSL
jgi:hypothetical protein